jgi:RNA polymerase sigma factor (sigma-70 family)
LIEKPSLTPQGSGDYVVNFAEKGRGKGIQHPFGKDHTIPLMIYPDRLAALTALIRNGIATKENFDEIARGFLRLAIHIAGRYSARMPNHTDDFVSSAVFGLVKALTQAKEKLVDDEITPYLASAMHSMCRRFQAKERVFGLTASQRWRRKQAGKDLPTTIPIPLEVVDQKYCRKPRGKESIRDLKELLEHSALDEVDRQIIQLRSESYNDREISEILGCSNSYVFNRRQAIKIRFDRLNED